MGKLYDWISANLMADRLMWAALDMDACRSVASRGKIPFGLWTHNGDLVSGN